MLFSPLDTSPFNSGFTGRSFRGGSVHTATATPLDPDSSWALVRPLAGSANPAAPLVRPLYAAPDAAKVTRS